MSDLRTASQQALEAIDRALPHAPHCGEFDALADMADALRAALAEDALERMSEDERRLGIQMQPVLEPVAWMYEDTLPKEYPYDAMWPHSAVRDGVRMFPVFAPPQRKPLTDEEIDASWKKHWWGFVSFEEARVIARAIERAHGIGGGDDSN